MFDATLQSETSRRVIVNGCAELTWSGTGGQTRLDRVHHSDPLRFLFPKREAGQPETAALVTTSGGLVGGDTLAIRVAAEAGAQGLAMTQAAEKVYRSAGPTTAVNAEFSAKDGSWLEWLPHETIMFDGAKLDRRTRLNVAADARAIVGEVVVFGRLAAGETVLSGFLRDAWEVRREGRLVWADAFLVDNAWIRVSDAAAGLAGHRAMSTIVCAAPEPEMVRDAARGALANAEAPGLRAGATVMEGLTIVRLLAHEPPQLRAAMAEVWGALRRATSEFSPTLPRLWHM